MEKGGGLPPFPAMKDGKQVTDVDWNRWLEDWIEFIGYGSF